MSKASSSSLQSTTTTGFCLESLGDKMNVVIVMNTLAYLIFFLTAHSGISTSITMDEPTRIDGFCVTNPNDPYTNSHMLSFYADVVLSIVSLAVVHTTPSGSTAHEMLERSIPGVFGHGLGHLFISFSTKPDPNIKTSLYSTLLASPLYLQISALPVLFFFWYSLLKTNKYIPPLHLYVNAIVHSFVLLTPIVPISSSFAYVQTVLVLTLNFYDIFYRPNNEKDVAYNWYWTVSIPFSTVAWIEATACTSFLRDIGGHMWYDASIPLAILVFYYLVRGFETPKKVKEV